LDWACWLVWLEVNDYDLHNSSRQFGDIRRNPSRLILAE
jgi:hypothetical protein